MEHFIKNIEITNFKSIRHAEVKDCRRVNVFVGYPNVGKSNILEALSLFSVQNSVRDGVELKDLIRLTEDSTIFFDGLINESLSVRLNNEFVVKGDYKSEYFKLSFSLENWEAVHNKVKAPHNLQSVPFRYYWMEFKTFKYYSSEPAFLKEHLKIAYPAPKKYDFKKDIVYKEGNLQNLYYPFGSNLYSVIKNNIELRKDFTEVVQKNNLELLFNSTTKSLSLFKRTIAGIFEVPWELIADTLQRMFFYKTAILSNKEQILLLEEPESHMFPPYISKMTGDIIYDENGNQFFIATHSPYVLGDLIRDVEPAELSVYIVDYDVAKGETIIYRMNESEVNEAYQFGHDFFMNINQFIPNTQHEQV